MVAKGIGTACLLSKRLNFQIQPGFLLTLALFSIVGNGNLCAENMLATLEAYKKCARGLKMDLGTANFNKANPWILIEKRDKKGMPKSILVASTSSIYRFEIPKLTKKKESGDFNAFGWFHLDIPDPILKKKGKSPLHYFYSYIHPKNEGIITGEFSVRFPPDAKKSKELAKHHTLVTLKNKGMKLTLKAMADYVIEGLRKFATHDFVRLQAPYPTIPAAINAIRNHCVLARDTGVTAAARRAITALELRHALNENGIFPKKKLIPHRKRGAQTH